VESQTPNENQSGFQSQSSNNLTSYPSSDPSLNLSPKKTFSPKVIGIIAAVIIVGLAIFFGLSQNKKSGGGNGSNQLDTSDTSLYHNREGYDPAKYQPGTGDPLALNWNNTAKPMTASNGTKIIPSCNIISLQNLQDLKAYVATDHTPTLVYRTYLDGVGRAKLETIDAYLPSTSDANECSYILNSAKSDNSDSLITIDLYQPPLVTTDIVQSQIDRNYMPASDIGSVKVFTYKKDRENEHTYMLRSNDVSVQLKLRLEPEHESKRQQLLETAVKNLTAQQTSTQGWAKTEYDTPTFKKSIALACELVNDNDFIALTGASSSQFVREFIATGTGVIKLPSGKGANLIENRCIRENGDSRGSSIGSTGTNFDQSLDIQTSSYQSDEGARYQMKSTKNVYTNAKDFSGIGDEAYTYRDKSGNYTTLMRKGRFVVELVLDRTDQDRVGITDESSNTAKLKTTLAAISDRLQAKQ
jgi:hypothetical protein